MIEWSNLEALTLIPVVLLLYFWSWYRRKNQTATVQFASLEVVRSLPRGFKAKIAWLPMALRAIAIVLAIVALARPREANTKTRRNVEGIDIMIALDISDSMLIEDMKPLNRLEAAKDTIKKFVEKRTSDRIGVVIFAGESFTLVPPTLDYKLILERVSEITTAANARIKDGTAIGVAMASASDRLKDSTAKSRVMIFMTDGENNSGTIDPETGLEIAKGYGIKVYSIGIGKDGPTRIPIYTRDVFGNRVKTYQPFDSTVNEALLERMGKETGGKYYRASKEDSLQGIFKDIDSLEKTKVNVDRFTRYSERFMPWLLAAVWIYLLSILLERIYFRKALS